MAENLLIHNEMDNLIRGALAFVMLGVGLSLTWKDILNIFVYPKAIVSGLILQSLIIPLLAFLMIYVTNLPTEWKIGFIILAACPGGTTTNFITYWFKGNLALSVALTNINAVMSVFTIPFITNLAIQLFTHQSKVIHLPFSETVLQIFWVTILPAAIGMYLRYRFETLSRKLESVLKYITIVLLGAVFTLKFFRGGTTAVSLSEMFQLFPVTLLLNLTGFLLGYLASKIFRLPIKDGLTLGVELGIHNTTLAFLVGSTLLHNDVLIEPALVYSLFSFWTAVLFSAFITKYSLRKTST